MRRSLLVVLYILMLSVHYDIVVLYMRIRSGGVQHAARVRHDDHRGAGSRLPAREDVLLTAGRERLALRERSWEHVLGAVHKSGHY